MMGIDHSLLKDKLKRHIQSFITELAPNVSYFFFILLLILNSLMRDIFRS